MKYASRMGEKRSLAIVPVATEFLEEAKQRLSERFEIVDVRENLGRLTHCIFIEGDGLYETSPGNSVPEVEMVVADDRWWLSPLED